MNDKKYFLWKLYISTLIFLKKFRISIFKKIKFKKDERSAVFGSVHHMEEEVAQGQAQSIDERAVAWHLIPPGSYPVGDLEKMSPARA